MDHCGIYELAEAAEESSKYCSSTFDDPVVNKLVEYAKKDNVMDHSTKEGPDQEYSGNFGIINSHYGNLSSWVSHDRSLWTKTRFNHGTKKIQFNEEVEIENFFNSLLTSLFRYYAIKIKKNQRQPWQFVPWMGDSINPRTGLKGYLSEWTDEDFYEFFGMTEDEKKTIEETVKKNGHR